MDGFTIGELAKQAKVHVETLRYYERRGLIPRPRRTVSNYRVYSSENLRRVKFIKQAQGLGFSLKEIKKLLALRATPRARCADVRTYAAHKIEDIEGRSVRWRICARPLRNSSLSVPATDRLHGVRSLNPLTRSHQTLCQKSNRIERRSFYEQQTKNRNL